MMDTSAWKSAQAWARSQLEQCIDFWLRYGLDPVHGGVYTCLDRKGALYSTDKSVWMQGRCAWTFAALCRQYGQRREWMDAAKSCLDFLQAHCINKDAGGRMYFTVTEDGRPLRQRRYCFSEGFYAIANAEYYGLTGEEIYLERARRAYSLVYKLNHGMISDPTGLGPKTIPATRRTHALADPMIFLNITHILQRVDPAHKDEYARLSQECVREITQLHFHPELGCTLENVAMDGEPELGYTDGRVVNPGHDIECSWFLMEEANDRKDAALHETAQTMFRQAANAGWDSEYGGLLYFIDCQGKPTEAYEHDMKLWWPHTELLIASLMAYRDTGNEEYARWFERGLEYVKSHFEDDLYGEWYGYLRRDGLPTMPPTKGSTFKGPFHLPRMLMAVDAMLQELLAAREDAG